MTELGAQLSRRWTAVAVLCLLTLSCFVWSLGAGFVYDDAWTIQHNSAIRSFDALPDLFDGSAVARRVPDAWRPLMVASQMLDYRLFGLRPLGYHLHSVLWHLACVLMVWLLIRRLFRLPRLALTAAALFAVHPIHVEAVAAINYREDLMAAAFGLAALVLLLRPLGEEASAAAPGPSPKEVVRPLGWTTAAAAALLVVGLLAKATVVVMPLLFVALRLALPPRGSRLRAALPGAIALSAAVAAFVCWRLVSAGTLDPYHGHNISTTADRLAGLGWLAHAEASLRTLLQLLIPAGLSPEYDQPARAWSSWPVVATLLGLLALVVATQQAFARKAIVEATGLAWLLIAWIPTSGLFPLPNLRADRYAYLPSVGCCLLLAGLIGRIPRPGLRGVVAALAVGLLAATTVAQVRVWRSDWTVWRRATAVAPRSGRAWTGLARAQVAVGQLGTAEASARRAVALAPGSGTSQLVLANILARQKKLRAACQHYALAEQLTVRHPGHLYTSWGWALFLLGDGPAAQQKLRLAIARLPGLARAHINLSRVLMKAGRIAEARAALQRAVELAPERRAWRRQLRSLE